MAGKYDYRNVYPSRQPTPQPVYTVEQNYKPYDNTQRYSNSEVSFSLDNVTVEDPPDGGIMACLVIFGCTILHICNEIVYFIVYDNIVFANFRNLKNATAVDAYTEFMVFEDVRLGGELVAAVFSIYVGYRVVSMFGSACVLAGFLAASFVTPSKDTELMGFLAGFLGGIGCSFWRFTAYVAIMEYFKKHRMLALVLSGFGRVIGIFIGYGVLTKPFMQIRDSTVPASEINKMLSWQNYYRCQLVMAGVAFFASIFIKPLSLIKSRRDCAWLLRMQSTSLCRPGMLALLLAVYFFYYLGESLPSTTLLYWMNWENYSTNNILGTIFALACGVLLGYILVGFWPRKTKLFDTFLWMGIICLLIGLLTLQLPVFKPPNISYVCAYAIILAACQVMFEVLIRYVIPIGFGRQYIRWIEGLLGIMACGATVANNFIAQALADISPGHFKHIFYFAGSAFVGAGIIAVAVTRIAIFVKIHDVNHEADRADAHVGDRSELTERPRSQLHSVSRSEMEPSPSRYYYGYQYR